VSVAGQDFRSTQSIRELAIPLRVTWPYGRPHGTHQHPMFDRELAVVPASCLARYTQLPVITVPLLGDWT
jgi:hypothetical protein